MQTILYIGLYMWRQNSSLAAWSTRNTMVQGLNPDIADIRSLVYEGAAIQYPGGGGAQRRAENFKFYYIFI